MSASYADLNVPGPTTTALTSRFWVAAEMGELLVQRCTGCSAAIFYPRSLCPVCWHDRLDWERASGDARLRSFSQVHRPGHPGWAPAAPYVVGLAELAEGPTMLSLILAERNPVVVGARLRFVTTNVGGNRLPAFEIV